MLELKIGIVMLGVENVERSLGFYRDQLGLPVQNQFPGFAFLNCGSVTLLLSEPLGRRASPRAGAVEVVFPVDAVRAAYDELRGRGVVFTQEPRNVAGPQWAANFNDPDGHLLSVFGPE
jgi:catechol 2,3-dioxygenase-like lactoylglutathione lyase family enzyme